MTLCTCRAKKARDSSNKHASYHRNGGSSPRRRRPSIKGESAVLNFPHFSSLLPRPVSLDPCDIQAAAAIVKFDPAQPSSSPSPEEAESLELSKIVELPNIEESFDSVESSSTSRDFVWLESMDCWLYDPPLKGLQKEGFFDQFYGEEEGFEISIWD